MKFRVNNIENDPFQLGRVDKVLVELSEPRFVESRSAWGTSLKLSGGHETHETTIYGNTALQSLILAAQFVMHLYEPDSRKD